MCLLMSDWLAATRFVAVVMLFIGVLAICWYYVMETK